MTLENYLSTFRRFYSDLRWIFKNSLYFLDISVWQYQWTDFKEFVSQILGGILSQILKHFTRLMILFWCQWLYFLAQSSRKHHWCHLFDPDWSETPSRSILYGNREMNSESVHQDLWHKLFHWYCPIDNYVACWNSFATLCNIVTGLVNLRTLEGTLQASGSGGLN